MILSSDPDRGYLGVGRDLVCFLQMNLFAPVAEATLYGATITVTYQEAGAGATLTRLSPSGDRC